MILRIFLWGALATIPVLFIEYGLQELLAKISVGLLAYNIVNYILIVGFTEEFFKYLVIRMKVMNSPNLDEPLDIMLYMTVAALGFATVENISCLLSIVGQKTLTEALFIYFIRSVGAVFLHTLCSAVVGYFLAISVCKIKNKKMFFIAGMLIATFLHGIFDLSMVILPNPGSSLIPSIIIVILAFFTFVGFERLRKMKGICKI
ncbi:MAG: PrsW family intramembrane metalloprotease [Candidatus Staskawiczbacteria bacterium]|nr:PrsW family intramembrane metalloprotease [Candidatus Staskawiczbacteria bacterium]